ncbi:MAG: pseudouridine-5'-phosphate glycosidase [Dehalococcoidia bacterium]
MLALAEAEVAAQKVTGNALTPALLAAAGRLDPRLIRANIALLEQNAKIAAEVALALG